MLPERHAVKIIDTPLENFKPSYPVERLCPPGEALFIDIETTGFTARSSSLYLIGCAYFADQTWHVIQWMAENPSEQKEILEAFFSFSESKKYLIHFNGSQFDVPYLAQKCQQLELSHDFSRFENIDVYKRLFHHKRFLGLENLKQKTIEAFLSIDREDQYSGGELISIYQDYVRRPSQSALSLLLLHNAEDVQGMLSILPALSYVDAIHSELSVTKVTANHYQGYDGTPQAELLIHAELPEPVPRAVTASFEGCRVRLDAGQLLLRIPVVEGELKFFYENYKEYYYLPKEDLALHKSVASYVDKAFREQATARNCYCRKKSVFLPQWSATFSPVFKKDYEDPALFFELTEKFKADRASFSKYASMVLEHVANH